MIDSAIDTVTTRIDNIKGGTIIRRELIRNYKLMCCALTILDYINANSIIHNS